MAARTRLERILKELADIRKELISESEKITPEEFEWLPRPDMQARTAKGLLREIATMEKLSIGWFATGKMLPWESAIAWSGEQVQSTLNDLKQVRDETLQYLATCTDANLDEPRPMPEQWHQHCGTHWPIEEAVRWVARHEYYHLGQLIYNRWLQGHNPYHS